jgi:ketosteroid isomerase-like protein
MHEPEFDPRLIDWLRDGPAGASDWVLESVVHHARRHPRRPSLLVRWSDAMKAIPVARPARPAVRLGAVLGAAALVIALAGLLYVGSQNLVSPIPTAGPTATPGPSNPAPASVVAAIDGKLDAWRDGRTDAASTYYATGATLRVIVVNPGPQQPVPDRSNFEIRPGQRGWEVWDRSGPIVGDGPYWVHPTRYGVFTMYDGYVVYRFDRDNRIEAEWVILVRTGSTAHGTEAAARGTLLDGCLDAINTGDTSALRACYAADAELRISSDSPDGDWTGEYVGLDAIDEGLGHGSGVDAAVERTGDMVFQKNLATYPFRGSASDGCSAGIDVFELTPDFEQVRRHWRFCGSQDVAVNPSATVTSVVDGVLEAWHRGDTDAVREYYASDATLHVVDGSRGVGLHAGVNPFEIRPGGPGYEEWERTGRIFHGGAYWAHAMWYGVISPGLDGFVVYRFDDGDRIEVEWVLAAPHVAGSEPSSAPARLEKLVDSCLSAIDTGDERALSACYAPNAVARISADSPDGSWTGEYTGIDAIADAFTQGVGSGSATKRTDEVVLLSSFVAYPFRGSDLDACGAGIDMFELNHDQSQVVYHWRFCGP